MGSSPDPVAVMARALQLLWDGAPVPESFWSNPESGAQHFCDDARKVIALLAAGGFTVEPDWQPIETAPRDGTVVLVFRECQDWPVRGYGRWVAAYEIDDWICRGFHGIQGDMTFSAPTHWRPLCAPPQVTP